MQNEPMDSIETKLYKKFTGMVLDSTSQITFKKPIVKFWFNIKEEYSSTIIWKTIYNIFAFILQLHICVKPDFVHILQPKHVAKDWMQSTHENLAVLCCFETSSNVWVGRSTHRTKQFSTHRVLENSTQFRHYLPWAGVILD